ncbi:MAG: acetylxylan esterase [Verrucomicrobiota bacterium]
MNLRRNSIFALSLLAVSLHLLGAAPVPNTIVAQPDHPDGIYKEGEKINWAISVPPKDGKHLTSVSYLIKRNGVVEVAKGKLPLTDNKATLSFAPGSYGSDLVLFTAGEPPNAIKGICGAVVAPEKFTQGTPCPEDFDAFWQGKIKQLNAIPANPVLVSAPAEKAGVEYSKITMDNINGTHVYGQIARPTSGAKFPAILQVQYAGVYPLQKGSVTARAASGWLAMNIIAHDIPIDEKPEFYDSLAKGSLLNYTRIGELDRETSYFVRMLLACYRAAEYLSTRPDWDGRVLVVTGNSQGGLQSFATAALFPKTTGVIVGVPAGCNAVPAKDQPLGWPYWIQPNQNPKVAKTAPYFDAANFAARVKCPILVGVGLSDVTSPPWGVYSAFNQAKGPKEIVPMPSAEHRGRHDAFDQRAQAWLAALVGGNPPPLSR